jgi:hypothetical protein
VLAPSFNHRKPACLHAPPMIQHVADATAASVHLQHSTQQNPPAAPCLFNPRYSSPCQWFSKCMLLIAQAGRARLQQVVQTIEPPSALPLLHGVLQPPHRAHPHLCQLLRGFEGLDRCESTH